MRFYRSKDHGSVFTVEVVTQGNDGKDIKERGAKDKVMAPVGSYRCLGLAIGVALKTIPLGLAKTIAIHKGVSGLK